MNLQNLNRRIHNRFHKLLRQFDGDITFFGDITKPMQKLLDSYKSAKAIETSQKPKFSPLTLISFFLIFIFLIIAAIKTPGYFAQRKIQKIINTKLETIPALKNGQVDYELSKKNLTIFGKVNSIQAKNKIDSLLHSVKGIKKLNNNLVVLLPEAEILRQIKQKISGRKDFKNLDNKFIIEEDQVVI